MTGVSHPRVPRARQIQALRDFGNVKAGTLGGYIQSEANLSHDGLCWIADNAVALERSEIKDDAQVWGQAIITDHAGILGNASVHGQAEVWGYVMLKDWANVTDQVLLYDHVLIQDTTSVYGLVKIMGNVRISFHAVIEGTGQGIFIADYVNIHGCSRIEGEGRLDGTQDIDQSMVLSSWGNLGPPVVSPFRQVNTPQQPVNPSPVLTLEKLSVIDRTKYPGKCPKCGHPAYQGFNSWDCSNAGCK